MRLSVNKRRERYKRMWKGKGKYIHDGSVWHVRLVSHFIDLVIENENGRLLLGYNRHLEVDFGKFYARIEGEILREHKFLYIEDLRTFCSVMGVSLPMRIDIEKVRPVCFQDEQGG